MTNQELISLSEKVAELYGVSEKKKTGSTLDIREGYTHHYLYLHQDLERVMRLAIEYDISIFYGNSYVETGGKNRLLLDELYANHPTKEQAVMVVVMKALIAKKEAE